MKKVDTENALSSILMRMHRHNRSKPSTWRQLPILRHCTGLSSSFPSCPQKYGYTNKQVVKNLLFSGTQASQNKILLNIRIRNADLAFTFTSASKFFLPRKIHPVGPVVQIKSQMQAVISQYNGLKCIRKGAARFIIF